MKNIFLTSVLVTGLSSVAFAAGEKAATKTKAPEAAKPAAASSATATIDTAKVTDKCQLTFAKDGKPLGKPVVVGVFGEVVPKTAANFIGLCKTKYSKTLVHRVIPNFMIQAGDYENSNGTGGKALSGGNMKDENFILKHTAPGVLSMANAGPDTNGSQFFITTVVTSWLDGKHVVFGKVIDGMDTIKAVEALGSDSGKTSGKITIEEAKVL